MSPLLSMKRIELTQNKYALVDDNDFGYLNQWKWYAVQYPHSWYAVRQHRRIDGKQRTIRMHRELIKVKKNEQIDHINHNGLDNRRENLRICNLSQNKANSIRYQSNTSGFKGVHYHGKKWQARISYNNKRISLGHFSSLNEAARAYNKAALKYHGVFANLNKT